MKCEDCVYSEIADWEQVKTGKAKPIYWCEKAKTCESVCDKFDNGELKGEQDMEKPNCCWHCKHLIALNPEEDKCKLDGHIFEDRLILSAMRDKECPLDKNELKGESNEP